MKKILRSVPVYLAVVMIACCMFFVPASAESSFDILEPFEVYSERFFNDGEDILSEGYYYNIYYLPIGNYRADGYFEEVSVCEIFGLVNVNKVSFWCDREDKYVVVPVSEDGTFEVSEVMLMHYPDGSLQQGCAKIFVNSSEEPPSLFALSSEETVDPPVAEPETPVEAPGLYYSAFDLFATHIYGVGAELTAEQNMTLTILATVTVLFIVCIPFIIVAVFLFSLR